MKKFGFFLLLIFSYFFYFNDFVLAETNHIYNSDLELHSLSAFAPDGWYEWQPSDSITIQYVSSTSNSPVYSERQYVWAPGSFSEDDISAFYTFVTGTIDFDWFIPDIYVKGGANNLGSDSVQIIATDCDLQYWDMSSTTCNVYDHGFEIYRPFDLAEFEPNWQLKIDQISTSSFAHFDFRTIDFGTGINFNKIKRPIYPNDLYIYFVVNGSTFTSNSEFFYDDLKLWDFEPITTSTTSTTATSTISQGTAESYLTVVILMFIAFVLTIDLLRRLFMVNQKK